MLTSNTQNERMYTDIPQIRSHEYKAWIGGIKNVKFSSQSHFYGTRQSEVSATAGEPGETDILAPAGTVSVRTLPEVVAVEQQLRVEGRARGRKVAQSSLRDVGEPGQVEIAEMRQAPSHCQGSVGDTTADEVCRLQEKFCRFFLALCDKSGTCY